jgi:hypothetical protein
MVPVPVFSDNLRAMSIAAHTSLSLEPRSATRHGLGEMVSGLIGSEILKIAGEVRALVQAGKPVCNLTVGDFAPREFRIPQVLEQAISAAYAKGETNYPPSDGVLQLRQAVQAFYQRALGLSYPLEGILVAGGARPLIYGAYRALLDPGDTVVYPVPSWNNNHYAHLCGARGVAVRARSKDGFQPTAEALAPHLSGAKLLVVNSPLNPAGTGFSHDQVRAIAELVVEENARREAGSAPLFLIYDQIYWLLAAESAPHFTPVGLVPEVAPYTVFVDGISKPSPPPACASVGRWVRPTWCRGCATCSATSAPGRRARSRWRPPRSSSTTASPNAPRPKCAKARSCGCRRSTTVFRGSAPVDCRCAPCRPPAASIFRRSSTSSIAWAATRRSASCCSTRRASRRCPSRPSGSTKKTAGSA